MTKTNLINQVAEQLAEELNTLLQASQQAHQCATHSESKAENKYDTLGLEAAYLAHGLSVRAHELQLAIAAWRQWQPPVFEAEDTIAWGALVTLEDDAGRGKVVLLAAQGGGVKVVTDRAEVTVVTVVAPLGRALLGRLLDDEVVLDMGGERSRYTVVGLA